MRDIKRCAHMAEWDRLGSKWDRVESEKVNSTLDECARLREEVARLEVALREAHATIGRLEREAASDG